MLSNIVKIRPHQLVDTVSINNCRTAISALSQPLAEIYRNQAVNQRLMEEKMAKVPLFGRLKNIALGSAVSA